MAVLSQWREAVIAVAILGAAWPPPGSAQPPEAERAPADAIKAAFLYNFTKFIDWPDAAFASSTTFNVCVYAHDQFRQELRNILSGEHVRGREIRIHELQNGADLTGCHLVYFDSQHLERAARRLPTLKQAPVLTVGEGQRFLADGGVIAFDLENNRVRFDVSKSGAQAAGLTVSSKLLRVARHVVGARAP